MTSGQPGWYIHILPGIQFRYGTVNVCHDLSIVPPLEGPNGVRQTAVRELITAPERFSITSSCEYPEIAMKWVDYLYSWEGSQNSTYGPELPADATEQKGWFVPPAGSVGIGGDEAVFGLHNIPDDHPNAIKTWTKQIAPWYQPIEWHSGQIYNPELPSSVTERMYYDATTEYEPYKQDKSVEVNGTPIFFMTPENNAAILEFKNAINTYVLQAQAEFVTGVRNLDTDWDSYVADLENYGLSQYIELYNQEYQAYLSR
jgi:putative aldouronate transport system substrate-binding protein